MSAFKCGDVVFNDTAEAQYFNRVRSYRRLIMIAQRDVEKDAGQKDYNDHASRGPGEDFEMKMLLTEQPCRAASKKCKKTAFLLYVSYGRTDLAH